MPKFFLTFCLLLSASANAQPPHWVQTRGPIAGGISDMAFNSKNDIFIVSSEKIRCSTDDGATWKTISSSLAPGNFARIAISPDDIIYVGENYDINNRISHTPLVYKSLDNGASWSVIDSDVFANHMKAGVNGKIYIGGYSHSNQSHFFASVNGGASWSGSNPEPLPWQIIHLSLDNTGMLYASASYAPSNAFISSVDDGASWIPLRNYVDGGRGLMSASNGSLFACSEYIWRYKTGDNDWNDVAKANAVCVTSMDAIYGFNDKGYIFSINDGDTWDTTFWSDSSLTSGNIIPSYYTDHHGRCYLLFPKGVYKIPSPGAKEIALNWFEGAEIYTLFTNTIGSLFAQGKSTLSKTTDKGDHWSRVKMEVGSYSKSFNFTIDSSGGWICADTSDVFRSRDNGETWYIVHRSSNSGSGLGDPLHLFTAPNGDIFFYSKFLPPRRSSDLGANWAAATSGLPNNQLRVKGMACDDDGILYTFDGQNIYRSNDSGTSWIFAINITDPFLQKQIITTSTITCIAATKKGEIFAGTSGDGAVISTDHGVSWKVAGDNLGSTNITGLFPAPNGDMFAFSRSGKLDSGIIYLPYLGNTWYSANSGLGTTDDITSMTFAPDGTAYLGTYSRGVWRSQGVVNGVKQNNVNSNTLSLGISPNPASSQITISYSLPEQSFTKLELCDELGRKVRTIENHLQDGGVHNESIHFNGLTEGIYLLRLSTPTQSVTEKIVITK